MKAKQAKKVLAASLTILILNVAHPLAPATAASCPLGTYKNSAGNCVNRPSTASTWPSGASAKCRDGTYSFSQSRRGTCSRHGGVSQWR